MGRERCWIVLLGAVLLPNSLGFAPPASPSFPASTLGHRHHFALRPPSAVASASTLLPSQPATSTRLRVVPEYADAADEASWREANTEGLCNVEDAMYCGLVEATDMALILSEYMDECNGKGKKLPQPAADVLRSLLSHQVGAQGFWTTFLTDPELEKCTVAPFDPSLLSALARFPELNMGVLSSCLAMSATEETVYTEDEDDMMRENAAMSRVRVLKLLATITSQPDPEEGLHGTSWLLDLVDYELLLQCMETAEERGLDVEGGVLEEVVGVFPERRPKAGRAAAQGAAAGDGGGGEDAWGSFWGGLSRGLLKITAPEEAK